MFQNRRKKFNKKIWVASFIGTKEDRYGNEIREYEEPIEYQMNVQPLTAETDFQKFGLEVEQYYKAIIEQKKYLGKFKEGDLAYLDGATPEGETKNGANANYELYPPRNQRKCILIWFKRLKTK